MYDASPDTPLNNGNQIYMSVDVSNENEGREMFESLLNQGKIHHNYRERERMGLFRSLYRQIWHHLYGELLYLHTL